MTERQPIETAPHDGTKVWLYSEYDPNGGEFEGYFSANGKWRDAQTQFSVDATHWRPLA